jgi:NDP-sugar pyrophosphorylase family protein
MNIIIPLGGKGERFKNQGYLLPKPLIKIFDKEILFYTIDNLDIKEDDNIFIIYNNNELDNFKF